MENLDRISQIEAEWESELGFFWKVRQGYFDSADLDRALAKLRQIEFGDVTVISRRLVAILWYMPIFLSWQTERMREMGNDVDAFRKAIVLVTNEIERILGTP